MQQDVCLDYTPVKLVVVHRQREGMWSQSTQSPISGEHTFCIIIFFELDIQVYSGHGLRFCGFPRGSMSSFNRTGPTRIDIQLPFLLLLYWISAVNLKETLNENCFSLFGPSGDKDLYSDVIFILQEEKVCQSFNLDEGQCRVTNDLKTERKNNSCVTQDYIIKWNHFSTF